MDIVLIINCLYMVERLLDDREVRDFAALIERSSEVVLTCHVRPDGDAIGSTLGLMHLLRSMGRHVTVVTPDAPPRSLSFLPGYADIVPYSKYPEYASGLVEHADMLIACDFNVLKRQDNMASLWEITRARKVMIDHHEGPDGFVDLQISYPDMSSTCELAFRLIAAMGLYEALPLDAATCLCTGIITDTRNLSVNTKHLDLYDIMVALLRKGVPKRLILKETMETKSADAIRLTSFALCERLKVYKEHRAAIVYLTAEDLSRFHYEKGDTEGLVNQALELRGIIYVAFMREDPVSVKVSMRSLGNFPVNKICSELYGGGGHRQAAGGEYQGSVQDAMRLLENHMSDYDALMTQSAESLKEEGYVLS